MHTPNPAPDWLVFAILGGFLVVFPLFWCFIVWMLSHFSGWRRLAAHYSSAQPVTGTRHSGVTGMVGGVSYRGTMTLHFDSGGFFLEVMPLFRIGHSKLYIPWSEITDHKPLQVLWWKSVRLSVGMPHVATITLPEELIQKYQPA